MTILTFVLSFHSTFRVGAAYPNDGVDLTYDELEPLPADHLKGLMRAEAVALLRTLGRDTALVDQTFGTPAHPSQWSWSSAEGDWRSPVLRHRVAIDPRTHAAKQDHLVASTSTVADRATFRVERYAVAGDSSPSVDAQAALLRLAARSIHHIGGWRRRGYGWVGISVDGEDPTGAGPTSAGARVRVDLELVTSACAPVTQEARS